MTAWGANWLAERLPVRLLLVGLMFASLLMSVGLADVFDGRALLFVTGYLLLQLGRALFMIVALRGRALGEHFVNDLVWELGTGFLRVAGAIADGDARLALWSVAVAATYAGALTQHWLPRRGRRVDLEHTEVAPGHLVERFRLFFIIALGETVLTMGTAFTDEPFELERLLALAIAFIGAVALWWCYFHRTEVIGARAAVGAHDAGAIALWATWTLALIVLGLIAIAVGTSSRSPTPAPTRRSGSRSSRSAGRRCSCSRRSSSWAGRSDTSHPRGRWAWPPSPSSRSPPPRSRCSSELRRQPPCSPRWQPPTPSRRATGLNRLRTRDAPERLASAPALSGLGPLRPSPRRRAAGSRR
jgi:hypothetical protein